MQFNVDINSKYTILKEKNDERNSFYLLSFKTDSAIFFVNLTDDRMGIFNIYFAVFCLPIDINDIFR